jgi:hypothetical protein
MVKDEHMIVICFLGLMGFIALSYLSNPVEVFLAHCLLAAVVFIVSYLLMWG